MISQKWACGDTADPGFDLDEVLKRGTEKGRGNRRTRGGAFGKDHEGVLDLGCGGSLGWRVWAITSDGKDGGRKRWPQGGGKRWGGNKKIGGGGVKGRGKGMKGGRGVGGRNITNPQKTRAKGRLYRK